MEVTSMKYIIVIIIALLTSFIPNFGMIAFLLFIAYIVIADIIDTIPEPSPQLETDLQHFHDLKREYMQSFEWDDKRRKVLKRDRHTCQICNDTNSILSVHHMSSYILIPNEPISCLITLCQPCHQKEHDRSDNKLQTLDDYYSWNQPIKI